MATTESVDQAFNAGVRAGERFGFQNAIALLGLILVVYLVGRWWVKHGPNS